MRRLRKVSSGPCFPDRGGKDCQKGHQVAEPDQEVNPLGNLSVDYMPCIFARPGMHMSECHSYAEGPVGHLTPYTKRLGAK